MRLIVLLIITLLSGIAEAVQTINVTHGHFDPIPIAINDFATDTQADHTLAKNVLEVITNDLKNSGLFRPISHAAFIENKIGVEHTPLFASWRQIDATILVNGMVKKLSSGKIEVSFILWDIVANKDIAGEVFELPQTLWRRAAHKIADRIYERVTGDRGYFDTKVAYISETGPSIKRIKRLAIMDQDGANHTFLTDGKNLVLTPRFSPHADKILYLAYINRKPRVHMRDLRTGKDVVVGNFPGMSFAPRFSPDGTKALMSLAKNGATNILELDFNTMRVKPLTSGAAISTSPSYSPDGKKIVFNSDRNGTRQLYTMNSDGSNVERISFGSGSYAAPVWSPRGDYIAFTKQGPEGFSIGVMRTDGSGERIITNGYLVEGPSFAGNGRVIMFARSFRPMKSQPSQTRIYTIDLTGYNEREVKTPKDASDPEWSNQLN
jgi:TolB protein